MNKQKQFSLKLMLLAFILLANNDRVSSQNQKITEAIDYINSQINNSTKISFSDNSIISNTYHNGKRVSTQIINLKDVSEVLVSRHLSVNLNCINDYECASYSNLEVNGFKTNSMKYLFISVDNYNIAERISNALRFILDESKKYFVNNDPYSSYSSKKSSNIFDLKIGMIKKEVFDSIDVIPQVELKEHGYDIYRIKMRETVYFLYFLNNKLDRVDKGVRSPDTIIKLSY